MSENNVVCQHGSLKRSCAICERDEEIVQLRAELAIAKEMPRFKEYSRVCDERDVLKIQLEQARRELKQGNDRLCEYYHKFYVAKQEREEAIHELSSARANIKRLRDAARGRGMASEQENWDDVAVLVCGVHDKNIALENILRELFESCLLAEAREELPSEIDWSTLDKANRILTRKHDITIQDDDLEKERLKYAAESDRADYAIYELMRVREDLNRLQMTLEEERDMATQDIRTLTTVLEWYSNKDHYKTYFPSIADNDKGERARAALKAIMKDE